MRSLKKLEAKLKLYKKEYNRIKAAFDEDSDVREGGIPAEYVLMRLLYKIAKLRNKIDRRRTRWHIILSRLHKAGQYNYSDPDEPEKFHKKEARLLRWT